MRLFFRNDDLGTNPAEFARLVTLFAMHDQKLNAAAIPSGLSEEIIRASIPYSYQAAPFLQVVTHGYSHQNHEREGKKCEYGISRSLNDVRTELEFGRHSLSEKFENYYPCFVPPWNRMHDRFLALLESTGYRMLSRETEVAAKSASATIPEFNVYLDLHTRKDGERLSAEEILRSLSARQDAGEDHAGVMLHHNRMTADDFTTLNQLLKDLSRRGIQAAFFSELLAGPERRVNPELSHV
ncbi:MAG: hypothetical protein EOP11_13820 [Proteobacteria bacterium]|nr:MAG: hypothetical protein EOP11_13820 [Pseudomonadota bacterium]